MMIVFSCLMVTHMDIRESQIEEVLMLATLDIAVTQTELVVLFLGFSPHLLGSVVGIVFRILECRICWRTRVLE